MNTKNKHSWVKHADFIALDLLALSLSFVIAYYVRFGGFGFFDDWGWIGLLIVACIVNLAITLMMDPYSGVLRRTYYEDAMKNVLVAIASFVCVGTLLFAFKVGAVYSRAMLGIMYAVYFLLSIVIKSIHKKRLLSRREGGVAGGARSLLVVSELGDLSAVVLRALTGDFQEYELVCICIPSPGAPPCARLWGVSVISLDKLAAYVLRKNIDDVLISTNPNAIPKRTYERLIANGATVQFDLGRLVGLEADVQSLSHVGMHRTIAMGDFEFGPGQLAYLAIKRVFDIVIGLIGCIVLLPVFIFVKIAYLVKGDTASIVYSQKRVGLRGRQFKLLKFRTMVPNADEVLERLLQNPVYRAEWERDQKLTDDPRITRVGRVLRKTSIDEFPQFWNILKGDMSLVGPRPLIPGELEQHRGLTLYNKVKPGITGWWACNGRSNIDYQERLEMEYSYIRNCSLLLDITCIVRTTAAVIRKEGAK